MQFMRLSLFGVIFLTAACSGSSDTAGNRGSDAGTEGGSSNVGGRAATGGSETTVGGASAAGSISSVGGSTTVGGSSSVAGGSNIGGSTAVGGASNIGGASIATGGSTTGGASNTGGTPAGGGGGTNAATGGKATGGAPAGGTGTGGIATGGTGTGGNATGGKATGGTATGGTGTGGVATCTAPPDPSPLVGWAATSGNSVATTTGGGNATPITVTTLSALQSAASGASAAVIYVKGTLAAGDITVSSNKTIAGVCGAEIHGHLEINGSSNVIIRNLKIVGYAIGNCALDPSYNPSIGCSSNDYADAITVRNGSHHIWVDHCDVSDGMDGNLDITLQSDYVTVSWTKFHYTPRTDNTGSDSTGASGHRFSNLVGGSDTTPDQGYLNVTWHHCWWADNVAERQPRVRFGKNHLFNNLWTSSGDNYCVRAGINAQILVENSVFSGVQNPQEFNNTSDQATAYITATGNVYSGTSGTRSTGGGGTPFTSPPYSYSNSMEAVSAVQNSVQTGAGPK